MCFPQDDDLTPVDTPDAKRKSGQTAAVDCPECGGAGCTFCNNAGKVSHFKRAEWELERGKALDRCPDTERNDR